MSKKLIISFEGIEGSGKSLHLKNATFFLKKNIKIKSISSIVILPVRRGQILVLLKKELTPGKKIREFLVGLIVLIY